MDVGVVGTTTLIWGGSSDAKPWTLCRDCIWDFDRACIYVSVCINAPRRGQYYCTLHLLTLSRVTLYS